MTEEEIIPSHYIKVLCTECEKEWHYDLHVDGQVCYKQTDKLLKYIKNNISIKCECGSDKVRIKYG